MTAYVYAEFFVPTRGMLGFRQPYLNTTRGTGTFNTLFHDLRAGRLGRSTCKNTARSSHTSAARSA